MPHMPTPTNICKTFLINWLMLFSSLLLRTYFLRYDKLFTTLSMYPILAALRLLSSKIFHALIPLGLLSLKLI